MSWKEVAVVYFILLSLYLPMLGQEQHEERNQNNQTFCRDWNWESRNKASVIMCGRKKICTQIGILDSKYYGNSSFQDHGKRRGVILKLFLRKHFKRLLMKLAWFSLAGFCSDCYELLVSIYAYCCVNILYHVVRQIYSNLKLWLKIISSK